MNLQNQSNFQPISADTHPHFGHNASQADRAAAKAGELDANLVKQRATEMFPLGATAPAVKPRLPPIVANATNKLVRPCFDAACNVKLVRGKLAREDAGGYILADFLGIELLAGEAIPLGDSARKAAGAAKAAEAALKNAASAKRSRWRAAATKDSERAAGLDAALRELDATLAADLAALQATPITLAGLPDRATRIVEPRPPKPAAPTAPTPPPTYFHPAGTWRGDWPDLKWVWCGPAPPGYRGVPCADDEERYWDPKKAPCVPSDCRPQHLFNSRVAAEAVFAALCVEWAHPSPDGFD